MTQAVDAQQTFVFPEGVEEELAERVTAMVDEAAGRLWVRRGKSTFEEQLAYWEPWTRALATYGHKEALQHCEIASYPGKSRHEEKRAKAVDVMCNEGDEAFRAELAKKHGLYAPIESSLHHFELAPNRHQEAKKQQGKTTYNCSLSSCQKEFQRHKSQVKDDKTVCCSKSCARSLEELRRRT